MNLNTLDLNLLVALDALLAEAHVGRAADRIGLSQPAASHALRRLRDTIGDPLLVRTGAGMERTPRAEALRAPLAETLDRVRGLFAEEGFDPATSSRRFAIMMPDLVMALLLPPLLAEISDIAPSVGIDVRPWQGGQSMSAELSRSTDLIITCLPDAFPGFRRERLYEDSDALVVRGTRPHAVQLSDREAFLAARHVGVVANGAVEDMIDPWLRTQALNRHIALVVPTYLQALHIAAQSDLVALVPRRLIEAQRAALGLVMVEPPADPGIDQQFLFYPARAQVDPGSIWLRTLLLKLARGLGTAAVAR